MKLSRSSKQDVEKIFEYSEGEDDFNLSKNYLYSRQSKKGLLSLFLSDNLVGVIVGTTVCGEAELIQLFIVPEFRGQGLGKKALNLWFEKLRDEFVNHIFLEVRKSNKIARKLYESLGFYRVGIRKNYYVIRGQSFDAVAMKLDI